MSVLFRSLLLLSVSSVLCLADVNLTATNPFFPNKSSDGTPVIGDPALYGIKDFSLSDVGTAWTLTIDTDYGTNIAGNVGAIPSFCSDNGPLAGCAGRGAVPFFMSDFLLRQGSNFYGVVLSFHVDFGSPGYTDSYVPGNLYSASGFQNDTHFGLGPAILATGGTKINTGGTSETVAANLGCSSGLNCAKFKITDTFTAPVNFFDTTKPVTLIASSADCFNEFITVTTPEPSGLVWLVPGLLLLGAYLRRRSLARVQ